MTCQEASHLVDAYADGELDLIRTMEFDQHVSNCSGCRARSTECEEMRRVMQRRDLYWNAPEHLAARVRSQLLEHGEIARVQQPRLPRRRTLLMTGLSVAASIALVFAVITTRPTHDDAIVQEVVSSHIRSLMASHLTDVPSSDQHTVKPWFNGRLDFAPPVQDLAASGYPLAGGRLDYIDGKTVAALVYAHRQHRINLFTWPSAKGDAAPQALTIKGYNVIHWTRSHISNWAVSDLNARDLGMFARELQTSR